MVQEIIDKMKLKKSKKSKKMRGKGMGTHGWGARKKHMGSGHRGGFGMAGTGKKGDQKKSLVIKKYGKYFGRQGIVGRSTKKKVNKVMNLDYIEKNLASLKKKADKNGIIDLSDFKILGRGELKSKITIKVESISASAKEKIEKSGSKVILPEKKEKTEKKIEKKEVKEEVTEEKESKEEPKQE